MLEGITQTRSRWRTFWPEVDDLSGANEAVRLGYWFAFLVAALGGIGVVVATLSGGDPVPGLVTAVVMGLIGVGLWRRSRAAAVAGALIMAVGVVTAVVDGSVPGVIELLTLVALLSGVRGTFAYHALARAATASNADSVGDSGNAG